MYLDMDPNMELDMNLDVVYWSDREPGRTRGKVVSPNSRRAEGQCTHGADYIANYICICMLYIAYIVPPSKRLCCELEATELN